MSKATKRKHVAREVLDEYVVPGENQRIVKILGGRGNNLHEAESPDGQTFLVSMPTKFRKNVWIKRGDYVIVEPIEEGNKVTAEIVHILYSKQVKYLKKENLWPEAFSEKAVDVRPENHNNKENSSRSEPRSDGIADDDVSSDDEDDDSELFVNTNRTTFVTYVESDSETESDDENHRE